MEKKEKLFYTLFQVNCDATHVGESLFVTGSLPSLGNWNPENSVQMTTNENSFPTWKSKIQEVYCPRESFEYKYLIKRDGQHNGRWEDFSGNRVIKIKDIENMAKHNIEYTVEIHDEWFNQHRNPKIYIGGMKENLKEIVEEASGNRYETREILEDQKFALEEKINLDYADFKISDYLKSLINNLVKLNTEKKTWKDKLSLISDLLQKETLDRELLALCSVYLFYINSGQIKCAENGTHFRPNHHSELAYTIFSFLLQNINEDNAIIVRFILKNLPSFSDQYLATVPLTRIRDIAHRGDIPKELKEEIKHTLQNKLHRSASPEDLKTCANILKRITEPGSNFSKDFVNEFTVFNEELKEFFNALGLEKALNKVKDLSRDEKLKDKIVKMIQLKYEPVEKNIQKLEEILKLRETLISIEKDELANTNGKVNKTLLQLSSTSEIELEDFGYTLISEYIDKFYYTNKKISEDGYQTLLKLCRISLDNMILSNIKPEECTLIKEDMIYFTDDFKFEYKDSQDAKYRLDVLKLKSVFERCLNLFYEITEDVGTYFNVPAYSLGKAMQLDPHSVRVFCESFVRGHTIFQFSKIITLLLGKVRDILKLPPFVTISTGEASGYYLPLSKLADFNPDKHKQKEYIVLLNESDGSEEIPNEIKGIVISHDLPQLSHLAIRARQNRVAFVCCLDNAIYKHKYYKTFHNGDYLSLVVKSDDNIKVEKVDVKQMKQKKEREVRVESEEEEEMEETVQQGPLEGGNNNHKNNVTVNNTGQNNDQDIGTENYILPIEQAETKIAGSKCTNMKLLTQLKIKDYETPKSCFIPYSVYTKFMNQILTPDDYCSIDKCSFDEIEAKSNQFREKIIQKSLTAGCMESKEKDIDHDIIKTIAYQINKVLPENCPLAIRSSSNLEDLKKSAGAGLFDSYLGIKNSPSNADEIKRNICKVWASIFTHRGIIARRNNHVPSSKAKMAVLVQEMIDMNFSFVIHTVNPITKDLNEVYIELAIGQGETLASAKQKGSPYRIVYKRKEDSVVINNYGSFAFFIKNGTEQKRISYKNEILSNNDDYLNEIGMRLGKVSVHLEKEFGGIPQDIEGGVLMDQIYMIQTRPQIL